MNAFENLLVDNKLANFQYSTLSTLTILNIQQLQCLTTFKQLSRFNFEDLTTFNFDNLVSNMQFYFSVLELATYRNLEVENFRLLTLKTFTFAVRSLKTQV